MASTDPPIRAEDGLTGGVFCPVIETTDQVIGERRLRTLRDLAAACQGTENEQAVFHSAMSVLGANPRDVPFAILYRIDVARQLAELACATGIAPESPAAPRGVRLDDEAGDGGRTWSLGTVVKTGKSAVFADLAAHFDQLPAGVWETPVQCALVIPILLPGKNLPSAVLVAAVSPMRPLDADYRTFYELLATQIASALADAKAREEERRIKPFGARKLVARVDARLTLARLRRDAEKALRQSEEKYQTLFDSIDEGLAIVEVIRDPSGQAVDLLFVDVNAAFERQSGLAGVRGRLRSEMGSPIEPAWLQVLDHVARSGESRRVERYAGDPGRWYRVYVSRAGNAAGGQVAIVFEDITDRKLNERRQEFLLKLTDTLRPLSDALEIQRAATRVVGEHLQVDRALYFEFERDGREYSIAENYARPGVPQRVGRFPTSLFPTIFQCLSRGETVAVANVRQTADLSDSEKEVSKNTGIDAFIGVPLVKEGRLVAQLGVQQLHPRDWTPDEVVILQETAERTWAAVERARAEEALRHSEERMRTQLRELEKAQGELQEADRRKNDFLAMLGHELRNPLAAIRGGIVLLRSEKARPESRTAALPIVAEQVAHMERLVDDLLDLTRIVQGRVQVRREKMAVQDALRQALEMVRSQLEAGGFVVDLRVPVPDLEILGDCVRLTQVFMNVVDNAIKYSGASRRIDVTAAREGDAAVVRCRDYGLGISPELLPRIFEPFVQVTPGLTLQAGLGLGLAVVRQLVRLHDGDVEVFTEGEGKGSEFVLRLPLWLSTP